ncbi:MAG: 50S ribosomal protein L6 [Armatimonadota bacterium]
MSRIGILPIPLPSGVTFTEKDGMMTVKGPKGELTRPTIPAIKVKVEDGKIICERESDSKENMALHGLVRSLVNNMVIGVTNGYEKRLDVIGVGYRAELQGKNLNLSVGYSHPVVIEPMDGISFEVGQDTNTRSPFVIVRGIDKETVGQQAALIRAKKPPEPYKGKGIKYSDEVIRRKAGKAAKAK